MDWADRIGRRIKMRDLHILLAVADQPYGANLFYGNSTAPPFWDSWERTKNWFAGAHQQIGSQTSEATDVVLGLRAFDGRQIVLDFPHHLLWVDPGAHNRL